MGADNITGVVFVDEHPTPTLFQTTYILLVHTTIHLTNILEGLLGGSERVEN
jgi:hypothetical protein